MSRCQIEFRRGRRCCLAYCYWAGEPMDVLPELLGFFAWHHGRRATVLWEAAAYHFWSSTYAEGGAWTNFRFSRADMRDDIAYYYVIERVGVLTIIKAYEVNTTGRRPRLGTLIKEVRVPLEYAGRYCASCLGTFKNKRSPEGRMKVADLVHYAKRIRSQDVTRDDLTPATALLAEAERLLNASVIKRLEHQAQASKDQRKHVGRS